MSGRTTNRGSRSILRNPQASRRFAARDAVIAWSRTALDSALYPRSTSGLYAVWLTFRKRPEGFELRTNCQIASTSCRPSRYELKFSQFIPSLDWPESVHWAHGFPAIVRGLSWVCGRQVIEICQGE